MLPVRVAFGPPKIATPVPVFVSNAPTELSPIAAVLNDNCPAPPIVVAPESVTAPETVAYVRPFMAPGVHELCVRATDIAGNVSDGGSCTTLTVVADTANGMGGLVLPAVAERLPITLVHLFPDLDGTFPNHPADPIDPENQIDVREGVIEHGADLGLAFDGDADRVFVVDERSEEHTSELQSH